MNTDYEKLGAFYLGRHHDLARGQTTDEPLLYDAKDLTTHAVCVGMTGSGKTGLCLSLLEEAAIDGVPALIIDPKGDLGNLLLTFPDLAARDFEPWINPDDARRNNLTPQAYAEAQAKLWREGLASWDQDGQRIRRLRESADFAIYTPGSSAGLPVSILASFQAPAATDRPDADMLRERVASLATSLLGLMGIDADPIRSREHILLSTILSEAWSAGRDMDLAGLIQAIQSPPVDRVGVFELDSFFPPRDRFALAMQLNNLLAAPGFQAWMEGTPLDVQELLYTSTGKPRMAILSIAHLSETERMFFVSLLLNQVITWMRGRPGTTSLRALVYMDEIFGFIPPNGEPPSKRPFLTLLKQARAYGLGVVLATQNPVDLDYKGLSNTGTWFLGRLQTERDKARVLAGLEGIAAGGGRFDKAAMERTLAGMGKRVFLMHNVHEAEPVVFHTRWAMSYMRGPMTRQQIGRLMEGYRPPEGAAPAGKSSVAATPATGAARPVLPPGVPQSFIPLRRPVPDDGFAYEPMLIGLGRVQYMDRKTKKMKHVEEVALGVPLGQAASHVDWESADTLDLVREELEPEPEPGGTFAAVADDAASPSSYRAWKKELSDTLYRGRSFDLLRSAELGLVSEPGESERDFRVRLGLLAREKRDALAESLRSKFGRRAARLEERARKARLRVEKEEQQVSSQKMQTAISFGTTLLSAFLGRKKLGVGTIGRATTAARGVGRTAREKQDVARAEQDLAAIETQIAELQQELENELDQLEERLDPLNEELETTSIRPRRSDVEVRLVALAWAPHGRGGAGASEPLW